MNFEAETSTAPRSAANLATIRVLTVLARFIGAQRSMGVTELAESLGMTKNMVHRALMTLVEAGYLVRDESGARYEIGAGVLQLRDSQTGEPDLRAICRPFMQRLQVLSGESVFLSIIVGRNRVNVDSIEAAGRRVTYSMRGRAVPLHITDTSRIMLAHLTDEEVDEYIRVASPLSQYKDTALRTPKQLWTALRALREQGFGLSHGEFKMGATYVAFPILDGSGRPHGAMTVGGPEERFTFAHAKRLLAEMQQAMAELHERTRLFPANPVFLPAE
jgi:DNA-binding IclR family transcriptional regulator